MHTDFLKQLMHPLLLFTAGFVSSFINIMAGGGSVLTLGVMMLFGLDASLANGTNRIGVLAGNLSGAAAFKSENLGSFRESLVLGAWALPGAVIGSVLAVRIGSVFFERILAVVMIFVIFTLFLPPAKSKTSLKTGASGRRLWIYPVMFCIGLYGGFIQAGVGFLIMASLRHILSMDLIKVNLNKNWIVLLYTLPILLIFGMTKNIHPGYAAVLALGNALGAWLSVKVSVKKGEKIIKVMLCAAILLMAVKLIMPRI
jgi:uncharacterized protein